MMTDTFMVDRRGGRKRTVGVILCDGLSPSSLDLLRYVSITLRNTERRRLRVRVPSVVLLLLFLIVAPRIRPL